MKTAPVKVIDLFAGPGGLGEGFSSIRKNGQKVFNIAISIEKESSAHKTLTLRAFFRQFPKGKVPKEYYDFLEGKLGTDPEEKLFNISRLRIEVENAKREARCLELGKKNREIYREIRNAIGKDECIVIGGPPCQAYSLVGRSRNAGNHEYIPEKDERNYLYFEYLKIIARFQPKVFVMENVKGLLSAKVEGKAIFNDIKRQLSNPCITSGQIPDGNRKPHEYKIVSLVVPEKEAGLKPKDYVIKCENYGIPQLRHRVILLGIRSDIADRWSESFLLKPASEVNLISVIGDLPRLRSGLTRKNDTHENWLDAIRSSNFLYPLLKKHNLEHVASIMRRAAEKQAQYSLNRGATFGLSKTSNFSDALSRSLVQWYRDPKLNVVCNHESKAHMESDLYRYLFCSAWAKSLKNIKIGSLYPKPHDYPDELKPKHANFNSGDFSNRFRVQAEYRPANTITSHIAKDGHYYIHYDPGQCRSLTVREAARIQTFPDNYFFVGNRTSQFVQVGNAVPPYLAHQIADSVARLISD